MFNIRRIPSAIILTSVCAFCAPLLSQKKQLVVVIMEPTGDGNRVNKSSVRGTMEQFITKSKGYRVVDRARADQVLGELNLQGESHMIDSSTAKAIGKHLGADFVCTSELIKEEGYTSINISLINAETGVVAASGSRLIEGENPGVIAKATEEIASGMLGVKK